ncbi:MAG: hypothetical protein IPL05_06960 [Betaproteobacteria bacterium]|nr:hypothetical protein [Betaproteobacteria bacterium]
MQILNGCAERFLTNELLLMKDASISTEFVYLYPSTPILKSSYAPKFSETLQPNLSPRELASCPVPLCSDPEQGRILAELDSKLSEADQLDQTLATALQQSAALRQSILKKAFCGQLVKQDKNDEPASVLLEHIRAGKLNGMKPGKREKSS